MLSTPSGTQACPDDGRRRRLADMIPGAATIRVSLTDPAQMWPHLHAVVKDGAGRTIELGCPTARVAARWILRVWPEVDWACPHTFCLADATLTRSDLVAAGQGR